MPAAEVGVSQIVDHRYVAAMSKPWGLCQVCNLGEAAHERSRGIYTPSTLTKRCPDCVKFDIDPCAHV